MYNSVDINILDYNSTDGLQEYLFEQDWFLDALNKNYISYYKNYDAKYYHRTLPKNCIHFLAGGTYLINIDADNFIDYSYIDFCLDIVKNKRNFFLRPHINNTSGAFGRIMMHHNDFKKIQGYNLAISRYGFEDSEITLRLRKLGIQQLQTPKDMLLQFIGHSDNLRLSKEAPIDVVKANCIYQSEFSNRTLKPLSGEESKKMYDLKIYQLDQKQARVRINIGGLVPIKI